LIVCYSGKSRASARNNWEIFKRAFERDPHVTKVINQIGVVSEELAAAIRRGSLSDAFLWSQKEWELRTSLWADIESPETQRLDKAARKAGANFTRVCGAGGGGVMAIFASKEDQPKVIAALQAEGGKILDAKVAATGYQITMR
jgi:D-glycero-alpha-D-manno-heptose-7-phosphate kinase